MGLKTSPLEKLIPNYNFHYISPAKNKCGVVGIYTSDSLTNVVVMEEIKLNKSCDCVKCETESLFIERCYRDTIYILGGIYRYPSGKVTHFISDFKTLLNQMDNSRTTVLAGDMNIDIKNSPMKRWHHI